MDLKLILENHLKWSKNEIGGIKANLSGVDLSGVDLSGVDFSGVDFFEVDFSGANLFGANFFRANLFGANFSEANLSRANLSGVNFFRANLFGANLSGANLFGANFSEANLSGVNFFRTNLFGANFSEANFSEADQKLNELLISHTSICAEGDIIGYKKCRDDIIVKLKIHAESKRSNSTSRKCRAEFVEVLEIYEAKEARSQHNSSIIYRVGEFITVDKFDENRWEKCSSGIHFFITKLEAENY